MLTNLIYHLYPLSFLAGPQFDGDKRSPLKKIIDFLPRFSELGVRYLWLSSIFMSPRFDHGYDVSDYEMIDPRFGSFEEFSELVRKARQDYDIDILMDLVLNHTSTYHKWFKDHPEYYCWSQVELADWENLFGCRSSWKYSYRDDKYYLHLFTEDQPDLNWFPNGPHGGLNQELVEEFRKIVDFWLEKGVAGFRLDVPQCINKDIFSKRYSFPEDSSRYAHMAAEVINAIFDKAREDSYLLMECFDYTGELARYYFDNTPVRAVMDVLVSRSIEENGVEGFIEYAKKAQSSNPHGYAHVLESHDTPRFTSAAGIDGIEALELLFGIHKNNKYLHRLHTVVMYQGQELGLKNPSKKDLPNKKLIELDAQTKIRYEAGESIDCLRFNSRSNARHNISASLYRKQEKNLNSCFRYANMLFVGWWMDSVIPPPVV